MTAFDPGINSRIVSSAATNNATIAKASGGKIVGIDGVNTNAAIRFLKFYDKATLPNPAADVPVMTFALAASVPFNRLGFGFNFLNGVSYALVTGSADNDNTSVGAGDIVGLNVLVI